ncbi:Ubinuclein-1 [Taenia solium]|eukprot:TsM_001008000 transcript=TsM_001008000 gene=TsM_001008000
MFDKTVVLDIDLLKNENRNEFSYIDLVRSELGLNIDMNMPAGNEDTRMIELAKSFERKYGNMVTVTNKGKRRRLRVDDFIDLGEGYDSQDSFIDDSEAVELIVAPTLRTRHGGFFVNEGFLESIEDRSMDIEPPPSAPKQLKIDLSPPSPKRPKLKKDKSKQLLERAVKQLAAPAAATVSTSSKTTKNGLNSLDAVFDSVLSASTQNEVNKSSSTTPSNSKAPSNNRTTTSKPPTPAKQQHQLNPPPLPPLSEDLRSEVQKILAFKPNSAQILSKLPLPPQFDNELLRFDELMVKKNLSKMTKSAVYAHIANQLCMKSKTLVGRLRKLKELKDDSLLEPMLIALKAAVSKIMPDILSAYNRDLANYQERLITWENERLTNPEAKRPGAPKKIFRWNSDCRSLLERIVAFRMEATFSATGKCHDEDQMKRFLHTLIPLWPENWISVAYMSNAATLCWLIVTATSPPHRMPGALPVVTSSAPNPSKAVAPVVSKPIGAVSTFAFPNKTTAMTALPASGNRSPATSKSSTSVAAATALRTTQSPLTPMLATSTAANARYVSSSNPQQMFTPLVSSSAAGTGGKEAGVYMLQFATSSPPVSAATTTRKDAPKAAVVAPLIDLTEVHQESSPQPHPLSSTVITPSVSSSNLSPPSIAAKAVSPVVTSRRVACAPQNLTSVVPTAPPAVRASVPSVTVSMGQILSRTPITVSQQQQQQQASITLQAVSNIISAFQQQNLQKQRLAAHENVRYTTAAAPILMNRHHQQQHSAVQATARVVSGAPAQAWNVAVSSVAYVPSVSTPSSVYSAPMIHNSVVSRPPQPQQIRQQQMRATFTGYNKLTEPYLNWSRQYDLAQGQSNDVNRTTDRTDPYTHGVIKAFMKSTS